MTKRQQQKHSNVISSKVTSKLCASETDGEAAAEMLDGTLPARDGGGGALGGERGRV